ncbi:beta-COP [Cryptosporidium felis]|nr:beta-COP [Cryptosporidium felis]
MDITQFNDFEDDEEYFEHGDEFEFGASGSSDGRSRGKAPEKQQACKRIYPITGLSDPVFIEAILQVQHQDVLLEMIVTNQSSRAIQNVQVELYPYGNLLVLEKPQSISHLEPGESMHVYSTAQVKSIETGILFGFVTFQAKNSPGEGPGLAGAAVPGGASSSSFSSPQAALNDVVVLNEIGIDLIDFITNSNIPSPLFRQLWSEFEWENKIPIHAVCDSFLQFLNYLVRETKLSVVGEEPGGGLLLEEGSQLSSMEESSSFFAPGETSEPRWRQRIRERERHQHRQLRAEGPGRYIGNSANKEQDSGDSAVPGRPHRVASEKDTQGRPEARRQSWGGRGRGRVATNGERGRQKDVLQRLRQLPAPEHRLRRDLRSAEKVRQRRLRLLGLRPGSLLDDQPVGPAAEVPLPQGVVREQGVVERQVLPVDPLQALDVEGVVLPYQISGREGALVPGGLLGGRGDPPEPLKALELVERQALPEHVNGAYGVVVPKTVLYEPESLLDVDVVLSPVQENGFVESPGKHHQGSLSIKLMTGWSQTKDSVTIKWSLGNRPLMIKYMDPIPSMPWGWMQSNWLELVSKSGSSTMSFPGPSVRRSAGPVSLE